MFRPLCIRGTQNCCQSNHVFSRLAFLSYIHSFHKTPQACRAYSSLPSRSLRLNTPLQVLALHSALGCSGSFSRTHHLSRILLAPHGLRWVCGCTHGRRSLEASCVWQTQQLKPREEQYQIERQHQRSDGCCAWSCHPTVSTQLYSETRVSSASCSAALVGYSCWWKSVRQLPGSETWLPLLPAVCRGSISRSAFPVGSPAVLVLSSFHVRRMAGKRHRLLTPSSLICWSWILFCSEGLMVSASRESVSDTPSLLFILVWSQLSYF